MQFLKIKNHDKYQHYGKRNPPWIKLYRSILSDYELRLLPISSRLAFIYLTIVASETDNRIPADLHYLSERFGYKVTKDVLTPLLSNGFLLASPSSTLLAHEENCSSLSLSSLNSLNSLIPKEGKESEKGESEFETFWAAYPKKVGKKEARRSWDRAKDRPALVDILQAIDRAENSEQWTKENGQFIPNPSTWLNQGRWADEHQPRPMSTFEAFLARGENNGQTPVSQRLRIVDNPAMGESLSELSSEDSDG